MAAARRLRISMGAGLLLPQGTASVKNDTEGFQYEVHRNAHGDVGAVFRVVSGVFSEAFPTVSLVSFGVVRFVVRFVVRVFCVEGACCEAGASMAPASWSEGWPCVACSGAAAPANFFS